MLSNLLDTKKEADLEGARLSLAVISLIGFSLVRTHQFLQTCFTATSERLQWPLSRLGHGKRDTLRYLD
jgi:hypothetical protein